MIVPSLSATGNAPNTVRQRSPERKSVRDLHSGGAGVAHDRSDPKTGSGVEDRDRARSGRPAAHRKHKRDASITSAVDLLQPIGAMGGPASSGGGASAGRVAGTGGEDMKMHRLPSRPSSSVSTMSDLSADEQRLARVSLDSSKERDPMLDDPLDGDLEDSRRHRRSSASKGGDGRRHRWLKWFAILCLSIWLGCLVLYLFAGRTTTRGGSHPISHERRLTFEDSRSGRFAAQFHQIDWTHDEKDGVYLLRDHDTIRLQSVDGTSEVFANAADIVASQIQHEPQIAFQKYWISPDREYILLASNVETVFRHSFRAFYWVYDLKAKKTISLIPDEIAASIQYAVWAPTGHSVAFVYNDNMYLRHDLDPPVKITADGHSTVMYGIPDWVYEEEVFQTNSATWWSPDSTSFVFLRTDERAVRTYELEFFLSHDKDQPAAYPDLEQLKYPRPGTNNPSVSLHHYDVATGKKTEIEFDDGFAEEDRLITEVKYLGPSRIFIRTTNRDSTVLKVTLYDPRLATAAVVRSLNVTEIDGGWFEVMRDTVYLPATAANAGEDGYIGLEIHDGYLHLALHRPVDRAEPEMLTTGAWEVVKGAQHVDRARGLVYFIGTRKSSTERHLYSVSIATGEIKALTDESQPGYYAASFSHGGSYYLLTYEGPGIPWQEIRSVDDPSFRDVVDTFPHIKEEADAFDLPTKHYSTIRVDGLDLNVRELRPPGFDASGRVKYPVLFKPYGGPISQQVSQRWAVDWHDHLASDPTMEYLVVTVDGRGTGFNGRKVRAPIRGRLGHWEAYDQLAAGIVWRNKPYVDAAKMAIWGWSFGGFLTLKVLERQFDDDIAQLRAKEQRSAQHVPGRRPSPGLADEAERLANGTIFPFGMAVAPVTDWRLYDSIYTERYLGLPAANEAGYAGAVVSDMEALKKADRFLIQHGTGDDNVHFQNTLSLLDRLNVAGVTNFDVHVYPDSDHSIYLHNANRQIYRRLTDWLRHAFGVRDPMGEDRGWYRDPHAWK